MAVCTYGGIMLDWGQHMRVYQTSRCHSCLTIAVFPFRGCLYGLCISAAVDGKTCSIFLVFPPLFMQLTRKWANIFPMTVSDAFNRSCPWDASRRETEVSSRVFSSNQSSNDQPQNVYSSLSRLLKAITWPLSPTKMRKVKHSFHHC